MGERDAVAAKAAAVEADQKLAALQRERDALLAAKTTTLAELEQAREAHKAQSAVSAREFKAVVRQRDDVLGEIDAARATFEEQKRDLASERAALDRLETELSARHEREISRLRRERDVVVQQRDVLRERLEKLVAEQRELLDELTAQSRASQRSHADVMPASTIPKQREPREPNETNVIDITQADLMPRAETGSGLRIPRVRPVAIPPPNLRML